MSENLSNQISAKDETPGGPHGWIQWKGTNVCMDVHCGCGTLTHVDAMFCYFIKCGSCGRQYSVGSHVKLHPLSPKEIEYVTMTTTGFVRTEV